jgi:hypothetical protein
MVFESYPERRRITTGNLNVALEMVIEWRQCANSALSSGESPSISATPPMNSGMTPPAPGVWTPAIAGDPPPPNKISEEV